MLHTFTHKRITRSAAGIVLAIFAAASLFIYFPVRYAQAAGLDPGLTAVAHAEDGSTTTLGVGQQLIVALNYQSSLNDIKPDAGACTINGKDVKASFQNFGDGTYQLVYTISAGDPDAAAGAIPFTCSFTEVVAGTDTPTGNSGVLSGFTTANTLAISASGDTGGDDTADISNATVVAIPSSGTLGVGQTLVVDIQQLDNMNDLTMADGFCKINNVETTNFENLGGGHYKVTHTYTNQDADVALGQLTFSCNVKNGAGQSAVLHFTESNTVEIDTQIDDGGLPPPGTFQTTVEPSTGTITPGGTIIIHANDSGGITDFTVDPSGTCTVNGTDVKSSFQAFGDHTYQMTYTVAAGDPNVAAGQLTVSCAVKNGAGVTGTINSIGSNTLAISAGEDTGDGNSTTDGNINGNVQGGSTSEDTGVLAVTQIDQIKSIATADGTIGSGWKWIFHITVPTNEPNVQLKFSNWTHSNGINVISPANNMRFSSNEAGVTNVMITAPDTYSPVFTATGDLNNSMPGKQIDVTVEMGVPVGSINGSYSATYGVKTSQP